MKLCVVGTGYVGLVAGTCFAESGNDVICVDVDERKIAALKRGEVPIYEPGLEELIKRNVAQQRLTFQTDLADAVRRSLICFIAVGTPEGPSGEADLSAVWKVAEQIGAAMNDYKVVVDKSTVPVGTAARVEAIIRSHTAHPVDVVSNPEFLKEGAAIEDFQKPDRVVIGHRGERARAIMEELYKPFVRTGNPILFMTPESAEMCKYAANAMLAARISLINEIANLCEAMGSDVEDVRRGVGLDRRIGPAFLFPGVGYGGSCFPKDVKALITMADSNGLTPRLLRAVDDVNTAQKSRLYQKLEQHYSGGLNGRRFAVWGLSFKPRTDDMREAPAVTLIEALLAAGAAVQAHDPVATEVARRSFGDRITYCAAPYDALEGADALLIVTEWGEFKQPDFERMRSLLRAPVIFDGRNLYELSTMKQLGFTYYAIGRPAVRGA
ncbi:MAG: UDP-glucose/GDP-mannose dehydrogenase family protein [Deltaproteobacteria bacterium]|nr:UDP-glucose/GDP-mannose dehydrogenase family protein [Deltaproteobacteria bacterium]